MGEISSGLLSITEQTTRPLTYTDLHILTKKRTIEPLRLKRAQADFAANMTGRDIIIKSRQIGFSTFIQAHLFLEAVNKTARVGVIAHDDDTTQKLRDMQQLFYDGLPDDTKPQRTRNSSTRAYYPQTNSQVYIGTAGNKTAGRGGTYSHLHGSEVAFWNNGSQLIAGMMQGVPVDGVIILESTANGTQGWLYEEVMAALRGESTFKVHFYAWWWDEDAWIELTEHEVIDYSADEQALVNAHNLAPEQIKFRRAKQRDLRDLFPQEYPESIEGAFLSSGDNVFGDVGRYINHAPDDAPLLSHKYVAGLDWGQANDSTALSIIDSTSKREVFVGYWRHMDWRAMRTEVLNACAKWRVDTLQVELNSASSNVEELQYEADERRMDINIQAFTMTNALKNDMVTQFKTGLQDDGLLLLDNPYANAELQQWQTKQTNSGLWTYTHPDGGHDDTVIARLAAWWAIAGVQYLTIGKAPERLANYRG